MYLDDCVCVLPDLTTPPWCREKVMVYYYYYKPHSTRAAASTAMKGNLFPVEDILRTAGWSNVQTFEKICDKPINCARTTSDVLFSTTMTNVVPDGL